MALSAIALYYRVSGFRVTVWYLCDLVESLDCSEIYWLDSHDWLWQTLSVYTAAGYLRLSVNWQLLWIFHLKKLNLPEKKKIRRGKSLRLDVPFLNRVWKKCPINPITASRAKLWFKSLNVAATFTPGTCKQFNFTRDKFYNLQRWKLTEQLQRSRTCPSLAVYRNVMEVTEWTN